MADLGFRYGGGGGGGGWLAIVIQTTPTVTMPLLIIIIGVSLDFTELRLAFHVANVTAKHKIDLL